MVTHRNNIHTSDCFDNIQIKFVKAHPFKFIFWVEYIASNEHASPVRVHAFLTAAFTLIGQHQTPFEISSH